MNITKKQKEEIAQIAARYNLALVLLFGSRVTGRLHEESDIDIGVLPRKTLSFVDEVNLAADFVHVFGQRVDFTNLHKAPPLLLHEVAENHRILYVCDGVARDDFVAYAIRRYAEAQPLFEMTRRSLDRFRSQC